MEDDLDKSFTFEVKEGDPNTGFFGTAQGKLGNCFVASGLFGKNNTWGFATHSNNDTIYPSSTAIGKIYFEEERVFLRGIILFSLDRNNWISGYSEFIAERKQTLK